MMQRTTVVVEWDDHTEDGSGMNDPDWGYHLRMGGLDAYEADPQPVDDAGDTVPDGYRPAFIHNMIAHPLLPLPVVWRAGAWLHRRTPEVVETWTRRAQRTWSHRP